MTEGRMTEIKYLFPEWRDKALTFSYDDAQIYDRRLVSIFNQHDVKGTFHLNSGTLDQDGFITSGEVKELYAGHEVACHAVTHPFFNQLSTAQTTAQIYEDRMALERYSGKIVRGFSYPFGEYSERLIAAATNLGIVYSRTVESTMNFFLPSDFMRWHPTCHHNQVTDALMEDFLHPQGYRNMSLLYVWGHSYEFERDNNWDHISHICDELHGKDDVWYATNIEIFEYVTAMRSLVASVDGMIVYNPAAVPLYLCVNGRNVLLDAGKHVSLRTCFETQ